jgi:cell division protein FtsL
MMNARVGTDALIDSRPSGLRAGGGRRLALRALLAAALIVAALTLYIWQRFQVIELGYKVDRFKTERETLVRMNNNLRIESASLKSLDRVERIAARQIGLKPVERERFVLVKVVPGAGAPEQEPGATAVALASPGVRGKGRS